MLIGDSIVLQYDHSIVFMLISSDVKQTQDSNRSQSKRWEFDHEFSLRRQRICKASVCLPLTVLSTNGIFTNFVADLLRRRRKHPPVYGKISVCDAGFCSAGNRNFSNQAEIPQIVKDNFLDVGMCLEKTKSFFFLYNGSIKTLFVA